ITLDAGAIKMVVESGKSLLPIGVVAVEGQFVRGDLVRCVNESGQEVARGLINYNADEAMRLVKAPSTQIPELLGYGGDPEMIHSDNLVRV
ncbi:MAG: glutamate 5-kinase, partial [Luminiphilus sp.]|nr:glutamate 5-kinase [Luminiphilus sp.]